LKHRMRGVWRDTELVDPNTHNNKLATYHSWFAIPFSRNERMPNNVPWYLHLDLPKHVMRNISRFRLRAHIYSENWGSSVAWRWFLRMCPMSWWRWTCSEQGACSFILPRPSSLWGEETFFLSVYTFQKSFLRTFQQPNPFCCGRSTNNLFMISLISRTIDFFFLSLWIYLWPRPVSSRSAKQPGWRSPPIVTIVTIDFLRSVGPGSFAICVSDIWRYGGKLIFHVLVQ